ncbi:MAG: FliM/FliN family flagellar motor switch protein [Novosphingobium sp.]
MKHEPTFVPERALARHCPELLAPSAPAIDHAGLLARAADRLARALGPALASLMAGNAPTVRAEQPSPAKAADLAGRIAPLAGTSVLAAGPTRLLMSVAAEPLLRLVDLAFGGRGESPTELPEELPLSAELMVQRLETLLCVSLAKALPQAPAAHGIERCGNLADVSPFTPDTALSLLTFNVTETGGATWSIQLALPDGALADLLGEAVAPPRKDVAMAAQTDPVGTVFADLPLTLEAVLVDMKIPFSTVAGLKVGQLIPVAVARNVPLRVGETTVAHGTVGAMDDRVAIQTTQAFA